MEAAWKKDLEKAKKERKLDYFTSSTEEAIAESFSFVMKMSDTGPVFGKNFPNMVAEMKTIVKGLS